MDAPSLYTYRAEVLRVIDGDTIDVKLDLGFDTWRHRVRVRFLGIDTPETRTRDPEEKEAGLAAKVALTSILYKAEEVRIRSEELDAFGRALSRVYALIDGAWLDLSDWLLENGWAKPYEDA